ncbi:MAG: peptide ABC transporter substrate-binding protein [Dehalococcoidia bacterium]|nr:peptide ABC transporter substrate-binding protein [Dehalococcoidia bacterium]MCB9492387.1 peptide ABC transporter substrate-binding protein [Dehalococcoidia bacterium]
MSQNRLLAILLSVLAVLVLVVGGLSAVLLLSGGGDDGGDASASSGGGGTTTESGGGGGSDVAAAASGRIRLASSDPITLDPHLAGDATSAEYIVEIFGGLMTLDKDLNVIPDIADSVEISDDGLVYTFTINPDAAFHDGRAVTAEDVAYSLKRAASRELSSPTALAYLGDIVGVREYFFGLADDVPGIQVVDDRTIQLTIDSPKPYFLAKLTYPTAFVVDREQVESNRNWTRRPNGTGPYKLTEWRLGERIVLEANENYHLGAPALKEAVYLLAGGSALTRWENDELDVAPISVNDVERARDPGSDLGPFYSTWPQFSISYLAFNLEQPPFDDVHVRRAMGMAIDRERIANVTFSGMFQNATGILMPGMPGYVPEDLSLPFDPEAARAELAQSKYADDMPVIQITEVGAGAEASIDMQAFIEQWREHLGLTVEVRQTDFASFLSAQDRRELQAFSAGWIMDYPDPEDILDIKFHSESSLNDTGYSNPEVDSLLEQARVEQNPDRRLGLYQDVERLLLDEASWLPLYFGVNHVVVKDNVKGWFEPPMVIPRLRYVTVER